MRLSAGRKMNASEPPDDRVIQVRDIDLGEMEIHLLCPVRS